MPTAKVAKLLPAALKANGYTQHDIDEWSMDLARIDKFGGEEELTE